MKNLENFISLYTENLAYYVAMYPKSYAFRVSDIPLITTRLHTALQNGEYNHKGDAFKKTCKDLGIKYNKKSINEYLNGE